MEKPLWKRRNYINYDSLTSYRNDSLVQLKIASFIQKENSKSLEATYIYGKCWPTNQPSELQNFKILSQWTFTVSSTWSYVYCKDKKKKKKSWPCTDLVSINTTLKNKKPNLH